MIIVPSLSVGWGALAIICYNAKAMILGDFNMKFKVGLCHLRQSEPFTSCSNAAKREVKDLKKGSDMKLIKSVVPKRFWDACLELEPYIRSNTAHCIYKLNAEVPRAIMSRAMSDISQLCEFEWFEWVIF